jgi:ribose 1,5-bisphosphate isomerase
MVSTEKEKLIPQLPKAVVPMFIELESRQSLGASRNIRQINDLLCTIADQWDSPSVQGLIDCLHITGDYFIETRGCNTPAVSNALHMVLMDLNHDTASSITKVQDLIASRRKQYNDRSVQNTNNIGTFGANLCADSRALLIFDYSSSVMAILKKLADRGLYKRLIVTEGRDLVGGPPIVHEATDLGHSVEFVLDMAFHHFLGEVDAVLVGAETIFANGDCWNTVGSYPIAVLSHQLHVPYYIATELIKIDASSFQGICKPMKLVDYSDLFGYPSGYKHPELIKVSAPNLDNIPKSLITGYITEKGILPSEMIWSETFHFLESIGVAPLPNQTRDI